ncbi:MAG: phosphatase PAP2 family protein [Clostridium sp.]|nr:phosphatase PAP2 family protein [Clostridium sp.]
MLLIISLLLSGTIIYLTKRIINKERPYQNIDGIKSIKIGVDKYSFPSGHSSAAFTIGTIFSLFGSNYLISIFFIILSALVAFSRIYLGVHYLTDTIAGSIIGALSSLVVYKIFI